MPETIKIKRLQYNGTNNVYHALFNKNNNSDFNTVLICYTKLPQGTIKIDNV